MSVDELHGYTKIDPWFLAQIKEIVDLELVLDKRTLDSIGGADLRELKRMGFSDRRLAYLFKTNEAVVRARRHALGIRPVYKRVDTCAAEFATRTAYMYSTYEDECEAAPTSRKKVMVLGGGPNRIGQGIEFDYCCVHASMALREDGFETIMVNCNPETVSTDYDTSDRLYFEPLTLEDVLEIVHVEKPWGVIVPVRRPDAAQARARSRGERRSDHRHDARHDRHGGGPRAVPADAGPCGIEAAAQPDGAHRG
jgi:carbamoyl-phosphate synthase large subunit